MKVEVLSVVRRHRLAGMIDAGRADDAVARLSALDVELYSSVALLAAAWDLRDNLTAYDACYVALADALGCPLLTADARIARAPGIRCDIEVL